LKALLHGCSVICPEFTLIIIYKKPNSINQFIILLYLMEKMGTQCKTFGLKFCYGSEFCSKKITLQIQIFATV